MAASSDSGDNSNSDTEFNPDGEIFYEENEYDLTMFSYDTDDPCIDVNVVFPDTNQCKLVVTHHVVLHDHAFDIVKEDTTRFRAKCKRAEQGCKWTFFASTSKKYAGCKVHGVYLDHLVISTHIFMTCSHTSLGAG